MSDPSGCGQRVLSKHGHMMMSRLRLLLPLVLQTSSATCLHAVASVHSAHLNRVADDELAALSLFEDLVQRGADVARALGFEAVSAKHAVPHHAARVSAAAPGVRLVGL